MRSQILIAGAALLSGLVPLHAIAQSTDQRKILTRADIRNAFVGNTIVSTPDSPLPFREFHAPGGQVYGSNETVANQDACWRQKGNRMCYAYFGNEVCFRIVRRGANYHFVANGYLTHRATVERGDPLKLAEQPQAWSCPSAGVTARNHR